MAWRGVGHSALVLCKIRYLDMGGCFWFLIFFFLIFSFSFDFSLLLVWNSSAFLSSGKLRGEKVLVPLGAGVDMID